ncbi:MAG: hypothetical protein ACI9TV_002613 [Sulfurimonas sp.]|jgi:hypothetical protein|uniref:hypothetical protein n=1 Tax=Sulfurimonas sp. TaxID=2022749 RepID=UPI0039E65338
MKIREFTIDTEHLDIEYNSLVSADLIEEYIEQDLEVPCEFIESLCIKDTYVNIKLSNTREYFNDDWYVNLQRVV